MTRPLAGIGVWSGVLRSADAHETAAAAAELESLGYSALWIPDVGGDVFGAVGNLLAATTTTTIATGILNLWMHAADETAAQHAALTSVHGPRFLVGIGISHTPLIDSRSKPGPTSSRWLRPGPTSTPSTRRKCHLQSTTAPSLR